jgi:hypothetical protein
MADEDLNANDLIQVGRQLTILHNPQSTTGPTYRSSINSFIGLLKRCGFSASLAAAKTIDGCEFFEDRYTGIVDAGSVPALKFAVSSIDSCLKDEASRKTVILSDVQPPDQLNSLGPLQPYQEALRQDLVTCLKAHLSRPAIVMAWALGYDLIRSWVFNDQQRLQDFNAQLRNPQVVEYHDFFIIGEQRVLETCRDAGGAVAGFTGKTFRTLRSRLDERNNFAHANFDEATPEEATVYVQRMVRIVTSPPFV